MTQAPPDLSYHWMPFTANRQFKANPRLVVSAKGMHYTTHDGRSILDGVAGLWCVNAGHGNAHIADAIKKQADELDYAPAFQMGHPGTFRLAERLAGHLPDGIDRVFYTNSGSESVETALKMAIAYHRVRGDGSRFRLIGRERGYHGVNFGGVSVGGMVANRKMYGSLLTGVDHIRHTHDLSLNAFSRGEPEHGAHWADDLERIVQLHDASTIAAVIVEPVAGSAGALLPPQGLPAAIAGNLRYPRHPLDLRRGHHRLWPSWRTIWIGVFRCDPRYHHGGQGTDQRLCAHGRGLRSTRDP